MLENLVKELRESKGLTQEELAQNAEIARDVISRLENGKKEVVTTDTMLKLSKALDKPVEEIFLFNKSTIVNKGE